MVSYCKLTTLMAFFKCDMVVVVVPSTSIRIACLPTDIIVVSWSL